MYRGNMSFRLNRDLSSGEVSIESVQGTFIPSADDVMDAALTACPDLDVAAAALPQVSFEPKLLDAAAQAFLACKAEAISPNRVRGVAENSSKPADHMGL